jgi:hypothetical protein
MDMGAGGLNPGDVWPALSKEKDRGGFMRKYRLWIATSCCLLAVAIFAWGQPNRKPGLWEITSTMTWQQSPFPPGMQMPPAAAAAFGGGPRTTQV